MARNLKQKCLQFLRDERGSVIVEFIFVIPLYVWIVVGTMQFFHAFRAEMVATKVSLAMADLVSRQNGNITSSFISGSHEFMKYLTVGDLNPQFRLTIVRQHKDYNAGGAAQYVVWSKATGTVTPLTDESISTIQGNIPILFDSERVIFLETWSTYVPLFNLTAWLWMDAGLGSSVNLSRQIAVHPRFAKQICWQDDGQPDRNKLC